MFMIEIAGVKVLYTGDFSRQEDRHLMAAEIPDIRPDVLIVVGIIYYVSYCYCQCKLCKVVLLTWSYALK